MNGTLEAAYNAVREFHLAFGHPAPDTPTAQTFEQARRRDDWINNETVELMDATLAPGGPDIAKQADAYLDIIYFALGGLVELGIEPSAIFDFVHGANMAKLGPDGKPIIRADGKAMKPDGWESPDPKIAAYIEGLRK